MTGVDKLELPQFSIVDIRLVSREVRFTTGETVQTHHISYIYTLLLNDFYRLYKPLFLKAFQYSCSQSLASGLFTMIIPLLNVIFLVSSKDFFFFFCYFT